MQMVNNHDNLAQNYIAVSLSYFIYLFYYYFIYLYM